MRSIVVVVALLVGCATPYQQMGFSGGYRDSQVGPGRYIVDVRVNSFTSRNTAFEYLHRRANELCPYGYEIIDADKSQSDLYIRNGDTVQNLPKANMTALIECYSAHAYEP